MTALASSPAPPRRWPRLSLASRLLLTVLLGTLVSSFLVYGYVRQQNLVDGRNYLEVHSKVLADRLSDYETLLLSAASYLQAEKKEGDASDMSGFVTGLQLEKYFPSVHQLGMLRVDAGGQPVVSGNLGPLQLSPEARELIRREALEALAGGGVRVTEPLPVAGGRTAHTIMIVQPCEAPTLAADAAPPCLLYLMVNTEQLLQEIDQLTPVPSDQIRIDVDGQALSPDMMSPPPGAGTGGGPQWSLLPHPEYLQTHLQRLGHTWTVGLTLPALGRRDPASLLAPLILLIGTLGGLMVYRWVNWQSRLNARLGRAIQDLEASRSYITQSQADLAAIFEAIDAGAAFTTPDGFVRLVNRRYLELLGAEYSEVMGLHIDEVRERFVLHGTDNREGLFSHESPEEYTDVTRQLGRRRGGSLQPFWASLSRVRVLGEHQALLGYLHVLRDVSDARASQQLLRDQEQRSRAVLDGVPHVLWLSDRYGRLTYTNQQFRDLLSGPDVRAQVHPGDLATYEELWAQAYSSSQAQEADLRLALRTPEAVFLAQEESSAAAPAPGWRWVSLKIAPLHASDGQISEWIAVATDVHARLLAEQLALSEQQHYRLVLGGLSPLVWTVDAAWNVLYINDRWYELQPGLPVPADLDDLAIPIHPDDLDHFYERVEVARESGQPLEVEVQMVGPQGLYRTSLIRAVPLMDPEGNITEWVGSTTDIDDQVRAEFGARTMMQVSDALSPRQLLGQADGLFSQRRSYQEALNLLARALEAGAVLWRADRSSEGGETLQLTRIAQCFDGRSDLSPRSEQQLEALALESLRNLGQQQDITLNRTAPLLAELGLVEFLALPLHGSSGSLRGVLGLGYHRAIHSYDYELAEQLALRFALALDNDVLRERAQRAQDGLEHLNRSLEERVRERTRELNEANRELEAFSYSVSHDLRTPLRHMTGFGELLRKKLQSENSELSQQSARYLQVILDSGQRMGHLIDDLLEFSRTGRAELRQQNIDLEALIAGVWHDLQPDREGRSATLQIDPLPAVYGDERLLAQVFTNLLGNALKYSRTRPETRIHIDSVPAAGPFTEIRVQDNGVGFDPRYIDKLFGVFQRLHTNDEFEGTGIGLANVRRIVLRHGGQVSARGELGVGATFSITLPLRPRDTAPLALPPAPSDTSPSPEKGTPEP